MTTDKTSYPHYTEYLERVLKARVYDVAHETPLDFAPKLSARMGQQVWLKREDLQPVFSFKLRGAYNKISQLSEQEKLRGVLASSAGNHAQGVALAAQKIGIKSVIVMPKTTPSIKVDAVKGMGAEVVLHGSNYDEAKARAEQLVADSGMVYIPPFDDPDIIAGQGTVGMEILRQSKLNIDAIFVAIGGGGLVAGIAAYVKSLFPEIKIIGVEPEDAASMKAAMEAGHPVELDEVGIFADTVAVKKAGDAPFAVVKDCVDEIITVTTDEMCAAIKDIYEDTRSVLEPAGALSVAGIKRYVARPEIKQLEKNALNLVAIACGANMNFDRLRHIAERAEVGEQREALFAVTIPERPGSFRHFCHALGNRQVTEFNYRYADSGEAHIFVGVEFEGADDKTKLVEKLTEHGYALVDMSNNELAKIHVRYMVGGRTMGVGEEVLLRLNFPERPGALLQFLTRVGERWNISLFHYRNHGSDFGRVLIGLQVLENERTNLLDYICNAGYNVEDESENPAYRLFLR